MLVLHKCQSKCHLGIVQHIPKIALYKRYLGLHVHQVWTQRRSTTQSRNLKKVDCERRRQLWTIVVLTICLFFSWYKSVNECERYSLLNIIRSCYMDDLACCPEKKDAVMQSMKGQIVKALMFVSLSLHQARCCYRLSEFHSVIQLCQFLCFFICLTLLHLIKETSLNPRERRTQQDQQLFPSSCDDADELSSLCHWD